MCVHVNNIPIKSPNKSMRSWRYKHCIPVLQICRRLKVHVKLIHLEIYNMKGLYSGYKFNEKFTVSQIHGKNDHC